MKATIQPEQVTAICDTREQRPLDLSPLQVVEGTLATGDYSVVGLESIVAIERKSLLGLVACCGHERERFDREIQRLLAFDVKALIVETTWSDLEAGNWRSQVSSAGDRQRAFLDQPRAARDHGTRPHDGGAVRGKAVVPHGKETLAGGAIVGQWCDRT